MLGGFLYSLQNFGMSAYSTFPGLDLVQVSSSLWDFTSLFGMGRGGALIN